METIHKAWNAWNIIQHNPRTHSRARNTSDQKKATILIDKLIAHKIYYSITLFFSFVYRLLLLLLLGIYRFVCAWWWLVFSGLPLIPFDSPVGSVSCSFPLFYSLSFSLSLCFSLARSPAHSLAFASTLHRSARRLLVRIWMLQTPIPISAGPRLPHKAQLFQIRFYLWYLICLGNQILLDTY